MRPPPSARVAAALLLFVTGCPKPHTTNAPLPASSATGARIGKLALILRATDRRVVDEDLRTLLTDDDPVVRARAALALGQIAEPSSLPDLVDAATDASEETRASAAFAMGLIADTTAHAVLLRLAGDPSLKVRAATAEALGRLHDAVGAPTVRTLLDDPDPSVRAAAALGTWKFADPEPFLDALLASLSAEDSAVRMASSYALARLASAATVPASSGAPVGHLSEAGVTRAKAALAARVTDLEPEVRMQVARGLASPRSGAELAVVGALTSDRNAGVRVNAVRSLGYPGVSIKPYLEHAVNDRDQGVARAAIEAVGKVGGVPAEETLNKILVRLEKGWLLEAALTALAHVDPSKAPGLVSALSMNPDPVMRASAAALIAGQRDPGALAAASTLLRDAEPRVQALAIPIVVDQDGPLSELLAGLSRSRDPVVRAAVADAVGGRFANPHAAIESRDDLFAALEEIWAASGADTIPDARLSVVDAVAKAGKDDRTRSTLDRALADPDVVVRRRAAARFMDVYGESRSNDVGPASDLPLSDYVRIVRWSLVPHGAVITMQRPGTQTGRFTVDLDALAAPMAAWNFSELAGKKFFDGATLHRVVPNFVVQDGDPRGDGYGGPGYSIRDEFNPLPFKAGVLGMASDGKDTAGSQWFITLSAQPHLDGRYTSFGRVAQGFREVVSQMRPGDTVVSIRVDEGEGAESRPGN
jgi:cyclophilin family peptidyl-prolyl cis-trans isomerase/HEAT repeat protein